MIFIDYLSPTVSDKCEILSLLQQHRATMNKTQSKTEATVSNRLDANRGYQLYTSGIV